MAIMTVLATAPAAEPVELSEAKLHLRLDTDDHNTLASNLIKAARQYLEEITWRRFITQTWDLFLDEFPGGYELEIPYPPLSSVTGVYYTPDGGSEQTFSPASYIVDTASEPGRIVLESTATWPTDTLTEAKGVRVRFVCGYGASGSGYVPEPLRQAILLLVGQWYDNPLNYEVGPVMPTPFAVEALIAPYRICQF